MLITVVLGCRPNAVKAAPILRELKKRGIPHRLVATGQHRSDAMMGQIMRDLEMPEPDVTFAAELHKAGQTHEGQTAAVMVEMGAELRAHRPDWLIVLGDVDSALGAALAAVKLDVRIAHVESGYRSHDWTMPEEVNRVLVDRMSDLLLCPTEEAQANADLDTKPAPRPRVRGQVGVPTMCVGNVMMDSLRWALAHPRTKVAHAAPGLGDWRPEKYAVLTVHRPSNVDRNEDLLRSFRIAGEEALKRGLPIIWPSHPRVREDCGLSNCTRIDPLGYLDMVALLRDASLVITDSGGVLEESLYLGKEIVSLRDPRKNERQHLLDHGVPACWKEDAAPKIVDALLENA